MNKQSEINYPNRIKKDNPSLLEIKKPSNAKKARLGADFEKMINDSNTYYLNKKIAAIYKKPTPIQVVQTSFPDRKHAKITEAYYKIPSTTDYNGIYKGYYIDFEAKSCHSKTFPFSKIFKHQVEHLEYVYNLGAIAFLLIEFPNEQETFYLPAEQLINLYHAMNQGGRKSIPYQYFKENAYLIKRTYTPIIDYLKIVDIEIEKRNKKTSKGSI